MTEDLFKSAALPDGEYAIVEILGHRTLIGRVAEVERFGTKMLQVEPIFQGRLLDPVLHGGGSIYAFTTCSKGVAANRAPTEAWQLPGTLKATISTEPMMLTAAADEFDIGDDV